MASLADKGVLDTILEPLVGFVEDIKVRLMAGGRWLRRVDNRDDGAIVGK